MTDESPTEPVPTEKKKPKSSFSWAMEVMDEADSETSTPRLISEGAMLGTCIVFLTSMSGQPRLDGSLHSALVAFCIAIPALAVDIIIAGFSFKPGRRTFLPRAVNIASWVIAGGGGVAAGALGVFFSVQHLDPEVAKLLPLTLVVVWVLILLTAVVGVLVWAMLKIRKDPQWPESVLAEEDKDEFD